MALDGLFCYALGNELNALSGAKVERLNQTARDELFLRLYKEGIKYNLIVSAAPNSPRVALCDKEDPAQTAAPTAFCMLLRKHLNAARITCVYAPDNERIICFEFDSINELGYVEKKRLYVELMGKCSNILLADGENKLLGALYLTDITSTTRHILIGMPYEAPPKQTKRDPFTVTKQEFLQLCEAYAEKDAGEFILMSFLCFSPLTARETAFRAGGCLGKTVGETGAEKLYDSFVSVIEALESHSFSPCVVKDGEGKMIAFSFTEIKQYGHGFTVEGRETLSEVLNLFFEEKGKREKQRVRSHDIQKLISNIKTRLTRKRVNQLKELKECENGAFYKRSGDLIIANIYALKQGMKTAELYDYETGETVSVKLDERLSPSNNAKAYYKKYTKLKHAAVALEEQIKKAENEEIYIESVADALSRAETDADFDEIRRELAKEGYIADRSRSRQKQRVKGQKPLSFVTSGGYPVRVGKNNIQNDELTLSADKTDIWFHVKDHPASHAVMYTGGEEPDARSYTEAAMLAAYHSSVRGAKNVAVDYTPVRFVKKPNGSKPGFVIYNKYYTAYVDAEMPDTVKVLK